MDTAINGDNTDVQFTFSQQADIRTFREDSNYVVDVSPIDALFLSTDALGEAEVPCQWHLSAGVAHGIDAEALRHGGLFLVQSFGLPYPK